MKKKFSFREKIFFSPWAMLSVFILGIALMNVVAFADHEDDNYERQKANIDMANDGIVGHTEHGIPVLESEIDAKEDVKGSREYIAKGLRTLDIDVTLQKGLKVVVLNENTLELYMGEEVYTILVSCVKAGTPLKESLTPIDFFDWAVAGSITTGSIALVTRNPVKNFGNPKIKEMMKNNDARLKNWDFNPRTCTVVGIQVKSIETPIPTEAVRG